MPGNIRVFSSNFNNMTQTEQDSDSPGEKEPSTGLARSGLVVSSMTFLSRILGLAREVVFAALFGDSAGADAFFVAFKVPNFLRRLFAEGAFSQAFVPVLSEYRKTRSMAEVKQLLDHVASRLGAILLLVTALGVVGAPVLAAMFGFGYLDEGDKFDLLVQLLRITFPYILLISLTGFAGAILNSYGRFAVPAMTPIFLNLSLIGCALLLSPLMAEPVMALAWGVMLAGLIQLMFQLPFLAHLKLMPRPRWRGGHPGVNRIITLMLPIMFSVSVGQINLLLDTMLATTQASGSVSWLYYGDRLMELPLGIFGVAIATVILPSLSRIHATEDSQAFASTLDWGLRCIFLVGLPAAAALVVLADPLVITLYQRGEFSVESVAPTVAALRAYALGLMGFMAIKVLTSAYFSRQDTRTPVKIALIAMAVNIVLNLVLIWPLAHVGLALATSIGALVNAGLLCGGLLRAGVWRVGAAWLRYLSSLGLAVLLMCLALYYLVPEAEQWLAWGDGQRVLMLLVTCAGGGLVFLLSLLVTGVRPKDFRH